MAALTVLAALVLGNAVIVYQVTTHDVDPSSGGSPRESRDQTWGDHSRTSAKCSRASGHPSRPASKESNGSQSSARRARNGLATSPIRLARRSSESSASSGPRRRDRARPVVVNPSGSSSAETTESKSSGGTSGGTGSSDSGGEIPGYDHWGGTAGGLGTGWRRRRCGAWAVEPATVPAAAQGAVRGWRGRLTGSRRPNSRTTPRFAQPLLKVHPRRPAKELLRPRSIAPLGAADRLAYSYPTRTDR